MSFDLVSNISVVVVIYQWKEVYNFVWLAI